MQLYTLPDITPNGSAVQLSTVAAANSMPTAALFLTITANGSSIRIGDANVGSSRGLAIPTAFPFAACPRVEQIQTKYELSKIYVYGGSGSDKVSITYGV